jgi:hypothetical protein
LIIIASIHQPSTTTFDLFDKLLLLSGGKSHYFGSAANVGAQFAAAGFPMPTQINPAEFVLELMNTDFALDLDRAVGQLDQIHGSWVNSKQNSDVYSNVDQIIKSPASEIHTPKESRRSFLVVVLALLHRSFIKSYRDIVAYGIRVAMYFGLAVMMGTIWLRLPQIQTSIQPVTNAIVSRLF